MFGQRLRKLRTDNKLTQKDLADLLKVSPSTIGMYEQGRRDPDTNTLILLAEHFNVSVDYLLSREDLKELKTTHKDKDYKITYDAAQYPHDISPNEMNELMEKLEAVGFDVEKLIKQIKDKSKKDD